MPGLLRGPADVLGDRGALPEGVPGTPDARQKPTGHDHSREPLEGQRLPATPTD